MLLAASHLFKDYGAQAVLADVSLTLRAGECLAITGPSGCGKSTLLHVLAGIDAVDRGEIGYHVDDVDYDLVRLSERDRTLFRRRHLGVVFQFFNLIPTLNVRDNLLLPRRLNDLAGEGRALTTLAQLGLGHRLDAMPEELSGGEQQRVAIARALSHEPKVLLADEPTGNLDVHSADVVIEAMFERCRAVDCAIVLVTHSMRVAERADRIIDLAGVGP